MKDWLEAGGWRLEAGGWRLEAGGRRPELERRGCRPLASGARGDERQGDETKERGMTRGS